MLLICEGIFFVLGIFFMVTGKIRLSRNRVIVGNRARIAGFVLFIPGPAMLLLGLLIGVANAGNPLAAQQTINSIVIVEVLANLICFIGFLVIAYNAPPSATSLTNTQELPDILTLSEAAQYLRVSESEVREMIETGRLKAVAIGGDYRISKEALNTVFHS